MAEGMIKKIQSMFRCTGIVSDTARNNGSESNEIFQFSNKGFLDNGRLLLEERVSLFHGKTNHIRCLSVNDLNTHFKDWIRYDFRTLPVYQYQCLWERRRVLVKLCELTGRNDTELEECCREIAIATEMGIHKNVHKLLACCLETETPVLIYEYLENGALANWMFEKTNQSKGRIDWKNRLRIAYEISHAVLYLHTAFPRPIIHTDLKPENVLLDENNTAKLIEFGSCVSIPEGKTQVKTDRIIGTYGYMALEYALFGKIGEKTDVYSFGVLFLELLIGQKSNDWMSLMYEANSVWPRVPSDMLVRKLIADESRKLIVANLAASNAPNEELFHKQFQASIELGRRCITEEEESRPTMEEVATQLKDIINSQESVILSSTHTGTTQ